MFDFTDAAFVGFTNTDRGRCQCCAVFARTADDPLCGRCVGLHPNDCACGDAPRTLVRLLEDAGFSTQDMLEMAAVGGAR